MIRTGEKICSDIMSRSKGEPCMRGLFSYRLSDEALLHFVTPIIDRDELRIFPWKDETVRGKWAEIRGEHYLLIYVIDSKQLTEEHVKDIVKQMTEVLNIKFKVVDTHGDEILYAE